MSNYYISKCCGEQVTTKLDKYGYTQYFCQKCLKLCKVTAMIDKPGGVPEKDKTEQIREIARDLRANLISVNTGVDLIIQKLEEQKQEMVEEIEKRKGESGKRLNTFEEGYKSGFNDALDTVLSIIKR